MASGEDQQGEEVISVFHFGNGESDVVFTVENQEFHCHRMFLVAKSPYFGAMFKSEFKEKDAERIPIEAEPVAFRRMLEILYESCFGDQDDLLDCTASKRLSIGHPEHNRKLWKEMAALLELADRFLVYDYVHRVLEGLIWPSMCNYVPKGGCYHCATKLLLTINYKMDKCKHLNSSSQKAIKVALERLEPLEVDINCSTQTMKWLMDRE